MDNNDLIPRGDVIKELWRPFDFNRAEIDHNIRDIPAVDAVEVCRCADCKYCHIEDEYEAWCHGGLPAVLTRATEDFCSHGQRREEDNG